MPSLIISSGAPPPENTPPHPNMHLPSLPSPHPTFFSNLHLPSLPSPTSTFTFLPFHGACPDPRPTWKGSVASSSSRKLWLLLLLASAICCFILASTSDETVSVLYLRGTACCGWAGCGRGVDGWGGHVLDGGNVGGSSLTMCKHVRFPCKTGWVDAGGRREGPLAVPYNAGCTRIGGAACGKRVQKSVSGVGLGWVEDGGLRWGEYKCGCATGVAPSRRNMVGEGASCGVGTPHIATYGQLGTEAVLRFFHLGSPLYLAPQAHHHVGRTPTPVPAPSTAPVIPVHCTDAVQLLDAEFRADVILDLVERAPRLIADDQELHRLEGSGRSRRQSAQGRVGLAWRRSPGRVATSCRSAG
eukprot:304027-Chlamydomonas_euryale.AAC.1